jgi:hypothetical protein
VPPTPLWEELGDGGRVGGVVEDQQPAGPLPERVPRPRGQLNRGQHLGQAQRDGEVGQGGTQAQLGFGEHPPAQLVPVPVTPRVGEGKLGLADPAHAEQGCGRHQRRGALAGQLLVQRRQLLVAADERAHRRRDGPRHLGRHRRQALDQLVGLLAGSQLDELPRDRGADLAGQLLRGREEAGQPLTAELLPQRPDPRPLVAVAGERVHPARQPGSGRSTRNTRRGMPSASAWRNSSSVIDRASGLSWSGT